MSTATDVAASCYFSSVRNRVERREHGLIHIELENFGPCGLPPFVNLAAAYRDKMIRAAGTTITLVY